MSKDLEALLRWERPIIKACAKHVRRHGKYSVRESYLVAIERYAAYIRDYYEKYVRKSKDVK